MRSTHLIVLTFLMFVFVAIPASAQPYPSMSHAEAEPVHENNVVGLSVGFVSLPHFHDSVGLGGGSRFGIDVDDSVSLNLDWSHFWGEKNGYIVSVSYAPTEANLFVDSVEGPEENANLYWVDVGWVRRMVYGDTAVVFQLGVGAVSIAYDDGALTVSGQPPATPQDDESLTAHIGLGARTLFHKNWFFEVKGRYHYVNGLNTQIGSLQFNDQAGMFEGTIGLAYQF